MPYADQEMLDAIQASTPEWNGKITCIHYSLGEDFDKFMDPKYLLEPMPKEMIDEYDRMHEEVKPAILEELIRSHKASVERNLKLLDFNDSYIDVKDLDNEIVREEKRRILEDQPPMSGRKRMTFEELIDTSSGDS